ncbi:phosphoesterase [Nanobdella aerobiophila]|uniref:Phosphoesterase n=1 Tax=Nanobdella aerobiophila TaxID=2586965 RepID=A0A915SZV5_9ARCH|nr:DHHA1 domain-containing protein [Nanobdella aerobiophila]BBL45484.1 phosphoesterase [Nanobdella aerobiophila]
MDFKEVSDIIKNSEEKILIVADSDLDGKMSLSLMKIILNKLNKKYMEYFRLKGENNKDLTRILYGIINNNKDIKTIIFLDTPMDDIQLLKFAEKNNNINFIYLDHHKRKVPDNIPENMIYFDVRALFNMEICTTSIVYKIGKNIFNNEFGRYSLIASIGAIGDFMFENDEELIKDLIKNYRSLYNGVNFTMPYFVYFYLFLIAHPYDIAENIDKALSIEDFIKEIDIKKLKKGGLRYYTGISDSKKLYESEKMVAFEAKSSGVLSTVVSAFKPNKLIIVLSLKDKGLFNRLFKKGKRKYAVSVRYQNNKKIDVGILMNEFSKKYGISGGGHPKAAGGLIYENNIKDLFDFFEKKLSINEEN